MTPFIAELKEVSVKRLVSGDKSTKIVLFTGEQVAAALDQIPAESTVRVTIEIN